MEWDPVGPVSNPLGTTAEYNDTKHEPRIAAHPLSFRIPGMPRPVRHLPVLQKWDCQVCGNCCHQYQVAVTEEERQRIQAQDWSELGKTPLFKRLGWFSRRFRLNHREGGACVFL